MLGGRLMQKILVVEDDIDIQDILKNHLTDIAKCTHRAKPAEKNATYRKPRRAGV